jgi:DNA-binding CsgD family transcriptional regulator/KaiC/GvpD/RAD55 family RecA-like ATPase
MVYSSFATAMGGVMSTAVTGRPAEFRAVTEFLQAAAERPSGLVIEGEAGIGKTTLWLAALEQARERGFRVLYARVGPTDCVLAYAAIADLLGDVNPGVLTALPDVQRLAVDRVLLRAGGDGPATNQHVVAAALASVVNQLAVDVPVVVAIDNMQWLDPSSQDVVVAFAASRFHGRVGLLLTERSDQETGDTASWLRLARPDGVRRIRIGPLSLGGLHALISTRLGRSFARPTMVQIAEISGGNPFFALELARAIDAGSTATRAVMPGTLAELMRLRLGHMDRDARRVLLGTASVADATVDLLARITDTTVERVRQLLDEPKSKGIITVDGDAVRFAHPLLARSVYTDASRAERRAMHRALAKTAILPELKARHMALAATSADQATLRAIDAGAAAARARGASAAAAELLELAIGLGGDEPVRRIRAAAQHFQAGDTQRALAIIEPAIERLGPGAVRAAALNLLAAVRIHNNSFVQAVELLSEALDNVGNNRELRVQTMLLLCYAQLNAGQFDASLRNASEAVTQAREIDRPALESQALATWATVNCMCGHGVDEPSLQRALELEDPDGDIPIAFRASANHALMLAWTGRLDEASAQMEAVRRRCVERGAETDMMFVAVFSTLIEIWRGRFTDARLVAEEAVERAQQLGGDHMRVIAMTVRAVVAAHTGRESDAREAAHVALEFAQRCGSPRLADWASISLGFLDVSVGNYAQALTVLEPLVSRLDFVPGTEIITAGYVPDAVEAMVALGRGADAEPLIKALETNGRRLDRPWMLAIGARCRSMSLAAEGDIKAASLMAEQAMTEHDRLQMPFERARTQLLLGQLQRRQRQKISATATLTEALQAFTGMGNPLWADRARVELTRTKVAPTHDHKLTPSERQVAELAASGMTNRDVATALFISPKTVEANLARVYRKLGIKSRAELGRHFGEEAK